MTKPNLCIFKYFIEANKRTTLLLKIIKADTVLVMEIRIVWPNPRYIVFAFTDDFLTLKNALISTFSSRMENFFINQWNKLPSKVVRILGSNFTNRYCHKRCIANVFSLLTEVNTNIFLVLLVISRAGHLGDRLLALYARKSGSASTALQASNTVLGMIRSPDL